MVKKFGLCSTKVKCYVLRIFCCSLCTLKLWANFRVSYIKRLALAYNSVFRKLKEISRWVSPRMYFVNVKVLCFLEVIKMKIFGLFTRVKSSYNAYVNRIVKSDVFHMSLMQK